MESSFPDLRGWLLFAMAISFMVFPVRVALLLCILLCLLQGFLVVTQSLYLISHLQQL
jgi:hypothetical protein